DQIFFLPHRWSHPMGGRPLILCCLAAGAATLAVRIAIPHLDPMGFKELDLIDRFYSVLYSLGFGVLFGSVYELLRARRALPPGVRGGMIYGIGAFLVGILPSQAGWRDKIFDPMELVQLAFQYLAAGAAVGAVALRLKDPVRRTDKPEVGDTSV